MIVKSIFYLKIKDNRLLQLNYLCCCHVGSLVCNNLLNKLMTLSLITKCKK